MAIDCPHSWYRRPQHIDRGAPVVDDPGPQSQTADASGSPLYLKRIPPPVAAAASAAEASSVPSTAPNPNSATLSFPLSFLILSRTLV